MSYFLVPNNVKYPLLSWILIMPSLLSNLICKGFQPIKVLYEISCDFFFWLLKYDQDQNILI